MTARSQITLDAEIQRRARKRASDLGCSLAEYVRRLVARDLSDPQPKLDPSVIFDLFDSGGSNIARNKHQIIGRAMDALHPRRTGRPKTRKRA